MRIVILILNDVRFGGMFKSGYHTEFDAGSFSTPLLKGLNTYFFNQVKWLMMVKS